MTILAFGCSITHGAELVHPYQSVENVEFSYPKLIANHLGVDCINYAISGISNEGIFHSILDHTQSQSDITAIIVGWTSSMRDYWRCDGRSWFIIPSWTASMTDIYKPIAYIKDYTTSDINTNPRVCSDDVGQLDILQDIYQFTMKYKFDQNEYAKKKQHYIHSIRNYCCTNNIKLIEITCMESVTDIPLYFDNVGKWRNTLSHPNKQEHVQFSEQIIKQYNL